MKWFAKALLLLQISLGFLVLIITGFKLALMLLLSGVFLAIFLAPVYALTSPEIFFNYLIIIGIVLLVISSLKSKTLDKKFWIGLTLFSTGFLIGIFKDSELIDLFLPISMGSALIMGGYVAIVDNKRWGIILSLFIWSVVLLFWFLADFSRSYVESYQATRHTLYGINHFYRMIDAFWESLKF